MALFRGDTSIIKRFFTNVLQVVVIVSLISGCATHNPNRGYYGQAAYSRHDVSQEGSNPQYSGSSRKIIQQLQHEYARWQGTPYRLGGESKHGIDCSAFVKRVFDDAFAYDLPRTTHQQVSAGEKVSIKRLQPGDLIFFKTGFRQNHVGVFVGGNDFIHASASQGVTRSQLTDKYWQKKYWQSRRVL